MARKFEVGDRVINAPHPDSGVGRVTSVEADEYSFDNFHYGVCFGCAKDPDNRTHTHVGIPFDNHKFLYKFADGLKFDTREERGCTVKTAPDGDGNFTGLNSDGQEAAFNMSQFWRVSP